MQFRSRGFENQESTMRLSNIGQRRQRAGVLVAIVATAAPLGACSSHSERTQAKEPSSYRGQLRAETERERREFIQDTQERIGDLDREIAQLEERIDHESEFVSEDERAGWKEDLFELRREREDAQARLDRARTASSAEWQASRNDVSLQMDRLEAGIQTLGNRIGRAFSGEPDFERERVPVRGDEYEGTEPNPPSPQDENLAPPGTDQNLPADESGGVPQQGGSPPGGPSDFGY